MNKVKTDNQGAIRGFCALLILLVSIEPFTRKTFVFNAFRGLGFLLSGVFLFYAGYNMINNFKNQSKPFDKFWRKKIVRIYLPFVISNILFLSINKYCNGVVYSNDILVKNALGINCANPLTWFIYCILVYYLCSWVVLNILKIVSGKCLKSWTLITSSIIILIVYHFGFKFIINYVNITGTMESLCPLTLFLGMLYGIVDDKFNKLLKNDSLYEVLFLFFFFALAVFSFASLNSYKFLIFTPKLSQYIAPILLVILLVLICNKLNLKSKVLDFFNKISLEIYLFSTVILMLLNNIKYTVNNNYVMFIVYLIITIALSCSVYELTHLFFDQKRRG